MLALVAIASAWSKADAAVLKATSATLTELQRLTTSNIETTAAPPAPFVAPSGNSTAEDGSNSIPPDVPLPPGWTYQDVARKCGENGQTDSEHSAVDCMKFIPAMLTGYLSTIKAMEADFRAAHPASVTPISDSVTGCATFTPAPESCSCGTVLSTDDEGCKVFNCRLHCEGDGPTSLLETGLADLATSQTLSPEARAFLETGKLVASAAALHGHVSADVEARARELRPHLHLQTPGQIDSEIKHMDRMEQDLSEQYMTHRKRDAPILADLQNIEVKEVAVERMQQAEDAADIKKAQDMAKEDWERAHRVQPPLIKVGPVSSPMWRHNVNALWAQVKERGDEENKHSMLEQAELKRETLAHMTPSPAQREELRLTNRLVVDDEELEGATPSQGQLVAAGLRAGSAEGPPAFDASVTGMQDLADETERKMKEERNTAGDLHPKPEPRPKPEISPGLIAALDPFGSSSSALQKDDHLRKG